MKKKDKKCKEAIFQMLQDARELEKKVSNAAKQNDADSTAILVEEFVAVLEQVVADLDSS